MFGAISEGTTTIEGLLPAADPISTAVSLRAMGVKVSPIETGQIVTVEGVGLDGLQEPKQILDCGNSGTTMRLMLGLLAGRERRHFVLDGDTSLRHRPMRRVGQPLSLMGADVRGRDHGNMAPLAVQGRTLHGTVVRTPVASAQVKSAILLAALTANDVTTVIEPSQSRDHSERMLRAFGADLHLQVGEEMSRHISVHPGTILRGQNVVVPGDISSAAFWLVAGALAPGSDLTIENVGLNPTRTGILDILDQMGAKIDVLNLRNVTGEPMGDLHVQAGSLQPFDFGGEIMPRLVDEVPILSVAACFCDGESHIRGAAELRVKETDRLAVMTRQLRAMGANIEEREDGMTIYGGRPLSGALLDSESDHRVAMSLAVAAALANGESTLNRSGITAISYPTFWDDFDRLHC
ncbi:3-phosphoshikimate 1-carboxyvinyltransferase [Synechococcus sp. M16CYN]